MWATLALLAGLSLTPGQGSDLRLSNERATYGLLGAKRDDDKLLPGDRYNVAFDIENLQGQDDGQVNFSMAMEVTDSKGKPQYKQQPQEIQVYKSLGGSSVPGFAHLDVGLDMPKGEYTLKVIVTDRATKKTATLTRKFEVLPADFGLVQVQINTAPNVAAPAVGVVGQTLAVSFMVVGFERDKNKKQPNLSLEMIVWDENKKPTLKKASSGEVNADVPEKMLSIPADFLLTLNRSGSYTVELKAKDVFGKKTATLSFPIKIYEAAK